VADAIEKRDQRLKKVDPLCPVRRRRQGILQVRADRLDARGIAVNRLPHDALVDVEGVACPTKPNPVRDIELAAHKRSLSREPAIVL
jgi:hypothetical protein